MIAGGSWGAGAGAGGASGAGAGAAGGAAGACGFFPMVPSFPHEGHFICCGPSMASIGKTVLQRGHDMLRFGTGPAGAGGAAGPRGAVTSAGGSCAGAGNVGAGAGLGACGGIAGEPAPSVPSFLQAGHWILSGPAPFMTSKAVPQPGHVTGILMAPGSGAEAGMGLGAGIAPACLSGAPGL